MKASLFAEDEDDVDVFQHQGGMKVSTDVSSPRLVLPASLGRPSGKGCPPTGFGPLGVLSLISLSLQLVDSSRLASLLVTSLTRHALPFEHLQLGQNRPARYNGKDWVPPLSCFPLGQQNPQSGRSECGAWAELSL